MLNKLRTLNIGKKQHSPEEIEIQFEITRANYLKDLDKVRKKYASKLLKLTSAYGSTCL